ncbi:aminoglycoside phosphotransferase family protein [Oceanobacillus salinisoli]|uniref:aminoglycoside phosphotransferase family protein n=1 Tax=Oceanobacillus salinisoli TaxID=2678611 RepID=UPI0012E19ABF|nr:aminoglycoside phosphotransferase family protein [Oceanobacillus salinisoli]
MLVNKFLDFYLRENVSYIQGESTIRELKKGFSLDRKYVIDETYLLKVCSNQDLERKKQEFQVLKTALDYSNSVPKGLEFNSFHNFGLSYMVVTYLPGKDAEEALPELTVAEQYNSGFIAGLELKKLHQIHAPDNYPSWYSTKKKKSANYLEQFQQLDISKKLKDILTTYITEHEHLMKHRPNRFQHDDFHPSNILIHNRTFSGIIDFGRMDWGDPIHDFQKLGFFSKPVSIPFTRGIIDGYHENEKIDESFWRLFTLYSAMHIVSALVWGKNRSEEQYQLMLKKSLEVVDDHDSFQRVVPKWYN